MSNSQEQSLDENVVFLPVDQSSPEFLHCEKERVAVERLLSAGPEAFYSSVGAEHSSCFLSPEEVSQLTSWAENYPFNQAQRHLENGVGSSSDMEDVCSTYFPGVSDTPAPDLELGWPVNPNMVQEESVAVHTSPPAEGEPPLREIIRRHLQQAQQVIAIVTDGLTDSAVIGDLHIAASRGVPVYIILNQKSLQENFTLSRLRHPNIRVRVLGGKTFCSRTGRIVVGEMKDRFFLVDLQTVIHGSYSLTWTDAHLHRQLVTVLRGPAVSLFDREFRVLFAHSIPAPDTWRVEIATGGNAAHRLQDFTCHMSHVRFQKQLSLEPDITNLLSPEPDLVLNWKEMGFQRDCRVPGRPLDLDKEREAEEIPQFTDNTSRPITGRFSNNGHRFGEEIRIRDSISPVTAAVPEKSTTFKYEHAIEKCLSRQLSRENSTNLLDRTPARHEALESRHVLNSSTRRQYLWKEPFLVEESRVGKQENMSSSKKPIILKIPSESLSSSSYILKKIQQGTPGVLKRGLSSTKSEHTQSMMDLSKTPTDTAYNERRTPLPRFQSSLDLDHMTPALALMRKRNDEARTLWEKNPKAFIPRERPRSSSFMYNVDWRSSLPDRTEGD